MAIVPAAAVLLFGLTGILALAMLTRQFVFSLLIVNRPTESPFSRTIPASWPPVTILIPAHNEERVIADCLAHMLALDYPAALLDIVVVNDRSRDGTGAIIDRIVACNPGRLRAIHRPADAAPGKPAAVADGLAAIDSEIVVFFDADYLPQPPLLKKLVAPFLDPQVGATMGRVVPYNANASVLTRVLDLERRGGYTIDQAARAHWHLLPQFGGTVGGIRLKAMREAGGWSADTLAEDTDLTYRLFIRGWTVEYVDDALCYEEAPEDWRVRFRQVRRWACGHNQCLFRYFWPTLLHARQPLIKRLDAALVLAFYLLPPLSLLCLPMALIYPTLYAFPPLNFSVLSAASFVVGFGNFAPYFQVIAATLRDRQPDAVTALPFLFVSAIISMFAAVQGLGLALRWAVLRGPLHWDKTIRFRRAADARA